MVREHQNLATKQKKVGDVFGATIMAVAHTTVPAITEYCSGEGRTAVVLCDTHFGDCVENGECDFAVAHSFHKLGKIDAATAQVPQVLDIKIHSDGSRVMQKCLSRLTASESEIRCFPVEGFADAPPGASKGGHRKQEVSPSEGEDRRRRRRRSEGEDGRRRRRRTDENSEEKRSEIKKRRRRRRDTE